MARKAANVDVVFFLWTVSASLVINGDVASDGIGSAQGLLGVLSDVLSASLSHLHYPH